MTSHWKSLNSTGINVEGDFNITIGSTPQEMANLTDALMQFDSDIFNMVNSVTNPQGPFFGQFYVNSLNDAFAKASG